MRRILVVDDDLHTRLAIRTWLRRCGFRVAIADGGANGLAALDDATFDLMIVDIFMPNMRGFDSIRIFHQRAPTVPPDRDFRLRIFRPGDRQSGLPQNGAQPRRDAMPARALQTGDVAQGGRRMPVGSRSAPEICRDACRRRRGAIEAIEGKYLASGELT
jgi:CheY-like chemotaxis protein